MSVLAPGPLGTAAECVFAGRVPECWPSGFHYFSSEPRSNYRALWLYPQDALGQFPWLRAAFFPAV